MAWYEANLEEQTTVWTELQTEDGLTYFFNTVTKETCWERPEELMNEEDRARQGEWVWLPDDVECYIPGKVTTRTADFINVETDYGEVRKIKANIKLDTLKWSSLQRLTPDLVLLDKMSTPLILHNLRKRFESGKIYTNIGTICISINPYTFLDPPIYGADVITKYRIQLGDHKQMPPHVYCIGDNAYKGLTFKNGLNQSIIISGESGAGKTEAAKQVVNYVSAIAGSSTGIENLLFVSNPILESFGNAKTVRNNNSSRFGKYMELYFDKELKLNSAFITNYLLEKIRVPKPMENERNYHIFYQLCNSSQNYIDEFGLGSPDCFSYLLKGNCISVDGIDDQSEFQDTYNAMIEMKFTDQQIHDTFQIIAGILHLGNVEIISSGSDVSIQKSDSFTNSAYFFGVTEEEFEYRLTTRKMRIRGQEPIDVPLKPTEAFDARDACAKFIYSNLFDWIVKKLNEVMLIKTNKYKSIGILDIFGFEIFKENSFEQMCINYTNEQLQQIFNYTVFKKEEELYKSENVHFAHVPFIDNEPIIKLIEEMPYGILNLLDEECRLPDGSEAKFLNKVSDAQKACKYFKKESRGGDLMFTLTHYAGPVTYSVLNFMEKNRDTLTQDLLEMVTKSQFNFLSELFPKTSEKGDRSRKATLGKQFKNQLQTLIKTLKQTDPHYIRCIKPNEEKAALKFVSVNCKEQLTYAGVFEAVQIRKAGFPFHMRHGEFVERYGFLINDNLPKNSSGCKQILQHFQLSDGNVKIGRSMMLYRSNEHRLLELKRSIVVEQRDLEDKLRKIMQQNPDTMENPEPFFEELAFLVRKAKRFKMETPITIQAANKLELFIESRIDPETKILMENAFNSSDFDQLTYAVSVADQYNYQTKMCKDCRKLLKYITRIREEVDKALDLIDKKALEACVNAAHNCYYNADEITQASELLKLDDQKFLQEQIRAAVRKKDFNRQIRLEIKLKNIVFAKSSQMFNIANYGKLKSCDKWAGEKLFGLGKDKMKMNFLRWQKDGIHSSLTEYPSGKEYKKTKKDAVTMFKNIQIYMGDRKPNKNQRFNKKVGIDLLYTCVSNRMLKNEFYVQLIKQLSMNPQVGSVKKGWDLLILALNSISPGKNLENYIYVFIKNNCPPSDKERFMIALQTIMLDKGVEKIPEGAQYDDILSGKNLRQPQYTDQTPPGIPSWNDLLLNWDEQEEEDDEILFTASTKGMRRKSIQVPTVKNTTLNKPVEATEKVGGWGTSKTNVKQEETNYEGPWIEYIDPESGYPYYHNPETEETVWEKPAEMP